MRATLWITGGLGAVLLVMWNVVVTVRLWRSPMYDRGQRVAQTTIMWLVPGMVFFVNWVLMGMPGKAAALDPSANDGATDYSKQGVGVHGGGWL